MQARNLNATIYTNNKPSTLTLRRTDAHEAQEVMKKIKPKRSNKARSRGAVQQSANVLCKSSSTISNYVLECAFVLRQWNHA